MKHLSSSGAALALLTPLALIFALVVIPLGCGSGGGGSSATPMPTTGFVQVGFVDSPSSDFQHILLNVVSVRINPSKNANVSDLDPNWRTIPAPQGAGAVGELQVDLNSVQDQVQLFNTARLAAQEYRQIELRLDPNHPGQIVPNCPQAPAANEGCLAYRFQLQNPLASLRTTSSLQVTNRALAPLVIDFSPGTIVPPHSSGGTYTINPTIAVATANDFLGQIAGSVSGVPAGSTAVVRAELTGTSQAIARTDVVNGSYSLSLPAADSTAGTSYDVFISGTGVSFAAASDIAVKRGGGTVPSTNFSVTGAPTGTITGKITDSSSNPIQGATLSLLIPSENNSKADCASTPSECVVVATANTDDLGRYPLPGNLFSEPPFSHVPIGNYTLEVVAAGYDPILAKAPVISGKSAVCGLPNFSKSNCSFHLANATISGTVTIDSAPAAGSDVQVLVMAEDTGTNTLENVLLVTIPAGATSVPYTLNIPTTKTFDLFASAQDFFNGAPSPFPGHTIEVLHGIGPGTTGRDFATLSCVGHASLTGSVTNPDSGTTVRLSKNDPLGSGVQLIESQVNRSGGLFSFCAPPDVYTAQRFENGTAVAGSSATVTLAAPIAVSTPCPSICNLKGGDCPGVCVNTPNVNLP